MENLALRYVTARCIGINILRDDDKCVRLGVKYFYF